ncbi:hypothetical protein SeMB42_g06767 [Synchytrium endobioticum]|nr:hypothetical protein SeMB42_g06767 [Synchytrium endobioticum]
MVRDPDGPLPPLISISRARVGALVHEAFVQNPAEPVPVPEDAARREAETHTDLTGGARRRLLATAGTATGTSMHDTSAQASTSRNMRGRMTTDSSPGESSRRLKGE